MSTAPQPAQAPRATTSPDRKAFTDRILYCRDCRDPFVFTVGEQRFFASKNFSNDPTHCPPCRQKRRNGDRRPRR